MNDKTDKRLTDEQCAAMAAELLPLIHSQKRGDWSRAYEIKQQLATEFGLRHGWLLTRKEFYLGQLVRRSNQSSRLDVDTSGYLDGVYIDHPYYYREAKGRSGRPVALAVHLYMSGYVTPEKVAICEAHGLKVTKVTDFPAWWNPDGFTSLVVYEPIASLKEISSNHPPAFVLTARNRTRLDRISFRQMMEDYNKSLEGG